MGLNKPTGNFFEAYNHHYNLRNLMVSVNIFMFGTYNKVDVCPIHRMVGDIPYMSLGSISDVRNMRWGQDDNPVTSQCGGMAWQWSASW